MMVDRDTVCVMPSWDNARLRKSEAEEMLGVYLKIADELAKRESLEKRLGDLDVGIEGPWRD